VSLLVPIRHSVSKISTWHFVTTKKYGKRIIQLGENPNRIYLVGSLGVDRIPENELYFYHHPKKSEFENNNVKIIVSVIFFLIKKLE